MEITGPVTLDPQTLLSAIRTRRSIRQFTGREVPPQVIAQIIEAGRLTPTGKNAQDVSFVALREGMAAAEALAVRGLKHSPLLTSFKSSVLQNAV
ncbi:nitroreductase family protein [uncultured Oscillibacter sp.]|uniref:nitroreductase family protein n=1 Tax=uncultured Oscillibacter sp. TaxID=876091 RepID=UPI002803E59E|nr:nitroreductase family protein [uncultured Oscillibacter sp.]